ncbi:MAG: hypothetical protein J6J13_03715 [Clostridia bacterium]|nr:hypothetical protein [Clostridia bacterium]
MIKGALIVILILLSISGICDIVHTIRMWIFAPKRPYNNICVIFLRENQANSQLRFIREQYRWYGNDFAEHIIAVTDDLSEEENNQCKNQFDNSEIIFSTNKAIPNIMRSLTKGS